MASGVHTEEGYIVNSTAPAPAPADEFSACGRADIALSSVDVQPTVQDEEI